MAGRDVRENSLNSLQSRYYNAFFIETTKFSLLALRNRNLALVITDHLQEKPGDPEEPKIHQT